MRALWIAVGIVVIVGVAAAVVLSGRLLGPAIEAIASQVTDTPVRVGATEVGWLGDARLTLRDLHVANPETFPDPTALRLGSVELDLDARGLLDEPIDVARLAVREPLVRVQLHEGRLNVDELRDRIEASARAGRVESPAEAGDEVAARLGRTRLRVATLEIGPGIAQVEATAIGDERPSELPLGASTLRDVGGERGATPAELTRAIALSLLQSSAEEVAHRSARGVVGRVREVVRDVRDAAKHLAD
jgi:hypothetical protein